MIKSKVDGILEAIVGGLMAGMQTIDSTNCILTDVDVKLLYNEAGDATENSELAKNMFYGTLGLLLYRAIVAINTHKSNR
jgi:hypothetical protein